MLRPKGEQQPSVSLLNAAFASFQQYQLMNCFVVIRVCRTITNNSFSFLHNEEAEKELENVGEREDILWCKTSREFSFDSLRIKDSKL